MSLDHMEGKQPLSAKPWWAKYRATDFTGEIWWFEDKPYIDYIHRQWITMTGKKRYSGVTVNPKIANKQWLNSLVIY